MQLLVGKWAELDYNAADARSIAAAVSCGRIVCDISSVFLWRYAPVYSLPASFLRSRQIMWKSNLRHTATVLFQKALGISIFRKNAVVIAQSIFLLLGNFFHRRCTSTDFTTENTQDKLLQEHIVDAVVDRTLIIYSKLENISTVLLKLFEDELQGHITLYR